ncbi:transposase [Mesoflavibacter zeaxanthinifaciens]|uniref:transposase n=1 Tax=Mesoflavibacter zeaxanthinifaciens TaxID=393060 RepID=UPI003A8E8A4F
MKLKPLKLEDVPQFYTASIIKGKFLLNSDKHKLILIESLQYLVKENRVIIYGYVIMDNHIHIVWKPTKLYSLKHTQLSFMKFTAQRLKRELQNNNSIYLNDFKVEAKDRKYQFWKRNPLCVDLLNEKIIQQKLNYIHQNPVKAQICNNPEDYRFSSARFYSELGDEFNILTDFRKG